MNDQGFDNLTRMYASEVSRRDFLKLIGNIFMGLVFTSVAAGCSKNDSVAVLPQLVMTNTFALTIRVADVL